MRYTVIINYELFWKFLFPVKRKQGVNNCFKPLISFALLLLSSAASRLKSEQKEKEKEILKLNTTQFKLINPLHFSFSSNNQCSCINIHHIFKIWALDND